MAPQRFPLNLGHPLLRLLLLLFLTRKGNAYVDVDPDAVEFRMGPLFRRRFAISQIGEPHRRSWHLLAGLGWRTNLRDTIAIVGSTQGVVAVPVETEGWSRFLGIIPLRLKEIAVSVEDPDGLIRAIQEARR